MPDTSISLSVISGWAVFTGYTIPSKDQRNGIRDGKSGGGSTRYYEIHWTVDDGKDGRKDISKYKYLVVDEAHRLRSENKQSDNEHHIDEYCHFLRFAHSRNPHPRLRWRNYFLCALCAYFAPFVVKRQTISVDWAVAGFWIYFYFNLATITIGLSSNFRFFNTSFNLIMIGIRYGIIEGYTKYTKYLLHTQ